MGSSPLWGPPGGVRTHGRNADAVVTAPSSPSAGAAAPAGAGAGARAGAAEAAAADVGATTTPGTTAPTADTVSATARATGSPTASSKLPSGQWEEQWQEQGQDGLPPKRMSSLPLLPLQLPENGKRIHDRHSIRKQALLPSPYSFCVCSFSTALVLPLLRYTTAWCVGNVFQVWNPQLMPCVL